MEPDQLVAAFEHVEHLGAEVPLRTKSGSWTRLFFRGPASTSHTSFLAASAAGIPPWLPSLPTPYSLAGSTGIVENQAVARAQELYNIVKMAVLDFPSGGSNTSGGNCPFFQRRPER